MTHLTNKLHGSRLAGFFISLLVLGLVAAFACAGVYLQGAPGKAAADAPPAEFSSARALRHVNVIGQKSHSMGTAQHGEVRDYILGSLREMGLDPEVQEASVVNQEGGSLYGGRVQNVLARVGGTENSKAILLAAHYDSVSTGPGAGDDGSGVAVVLETLRALRAGPPLKNDVIALFTDGEEVGLLGAQAFVNEHPWAEDAGLVLNFEARGNSGPSLMFETSEHNGWLVENISQLPTPPVGNSLFYEVYRRLPNDTDFSVFKRAGYAGLNFAFVDGVTAYHSSLDTPQNLDERSLADQGRNSLSLTRQFGHQNLLEREEKDAVYFNGLGRSLIHYGRGWVLPLNLAAAALLLGLIAAGLKRRRIGWMGLLIGVAGPLLSMGVTLVLVKLLTGLAERLRGSEAWFTLNYDRDIFNLGFVALALAVTSVCYAVGRRKAGGESLLAGALLCWLPPTLAAGVLAPGASYLFTWPVLLGLLGLAVMLFARADESPVLHAACVLLFVAAPAVILLAPTVNTILIGVGLSSSSSVMLLVVLFFCALLPQLEFVGRAAGAASRWAAPACAALACALCVAGGLAGFAPRGGGQTPSSLFYVLDASGRKAVWATSDQRPDEWSGLFLTGSPERGRVAENAPESLGEYLNASAPVAELPSPSIEVVEDRREGDSRLLRLRLKSPRRAASINMYLDPSVKVLDTFVDGRHIKDQPEGEAARGPWEFHYLNAPAEGLELTLRIDGAGALKGSLLDQAYELPRLPGVTIPPRPERLMPSRFPLSDSTLVIEGFTI
ncbi:MAG TPA: M20/M25/M40 family metallo-hydrolase [Pyrinomonadaceae bacterium]|jgi:hypothetical protein